MTDETDETTAEEMLEHLCWMTAATAERFFPPDETALDCLDAAVENYTEHDRTFTELADGHGYEKGYHYRAIIDATELFEQLYHNGFDPVQMSNDYVEKARENGSNITKVDFRWLRMSSLPNEYTEAAIVDEAIINTEVGSVVVNNRDVFGRYFEDGEGSEAEDELVEAVLERLDFDADPEAVRAEVRRHLPHDDA